MDQQQRGMQGDLRSALQRADVPNHAAMPLGGDLSLVDIARSSPVGQVMPVLRMPVMRVEAKTEIAAFIDHHFSGRTISDGTILELSKENLTEKLTELFLSLEQRAAVATEDRFPQAERSGKPRRSQQDVNPSDK